MSILFRCHNLADIMTAPKSKSDLVSVAAKTACYAMAREIVFGMRGRIDTKYFRKGLECEDVSIELLNEVLGTDHVKNTERRENGYLTGEPDIVGKDYGIDIKTSWSSDTFPLVPEQGYDKTYEWQCRGYMWLFDKPVWHVAYCLVDTPQELIGYEDPTIHRVSHIPTALRVTRVTYERDETLENEIVTRVTAAREFLNDVLAKIEEKRELFGDLNPLSLAGKALISAAAADFLNA